MINNGAVSVVATIIHNIMSSVAEAKIVAIYLNAKDSIGISNTSE